MPRTFIITSGLLSATLSVSAASFVTVQCYPPLDSAVTTVSTTYSASCSGGASYPSRIGNAFASASVGLSLATDPDQFSTVTTSMASYVQQAYQNDPENPSRMPGGGAQASINYRTSIATDGPTRSGYLQLDFTYSNASFYDGDAQSAVGIQVPNASLLTDVSCNSNGSVGSACSPGLTYYQRFGLIPVTLGSPYRLYATGNLNNVATGFDGASSGFLTVVYRFRFLESDQTTAVQALEVSDMTPAPEPSSWALLIAGAGLLAARTACRS
jgi:hypothetical protein